MIRKIIFIFIFLIFSTQANSITFNFKDAELRDVIEAFALLVGKSYIIDSRVAGKVNVISTEDMSIDEAEKMLHSILKVYGFVMQEQENIVKIVPDQLMREGSLIIDKNNILNNDQIVTQLFRLFNIPVSQFINAIQPLLPVESSLVPLQNKNSLIVTTTATSINKIQRIIEKIDEPNLTNTDIIEIQNLNAIDVAKVLDRFFSDEKRAVGINFSVPIFLVDKKTNSIIIKSHLSDSQQIRDLIESLEEKNKIIDETQVVYLKHAQADYLAQTLRLSLIHI